MTTKTIRGRLVPSNAEAAACAFVRVRLYWSFTENGLRNLVTSDSKWDENGITFNSVTPAAGEEDLAKFITELGNVLKTEDAVRLGLGGSFSVVIDTEGTSQTFTIIVKDGKIDYEEVSPLKVDENVLV